MAVKRRPVEDRFWEKVTKNGPTMPHMSTPCWVWTGATRHFGYGVINMGGHKGRIESAHRVSWVIHYGPIPDNICVLHTCDNPLCIRPDHLFLGTRADNNHDMQQKGRCDRLKRAKGVRHWKAKLTSDKVLEIRARYAKDKPTYISLAKQYDITLQQIYRIVHRQAWRHI